MTRDVYEIARDCFKIASNRAMFRDYGVIIPLGPNRAHQAYVQDINRMFVDNEGKLHIIDYRNNEYIA